MSGTPLAPSVEKAYYRKCIELKRRLNEVEAANDEKKIARVRLDRSIMKMRLERAFLLEQLSKRMEHNVDGSDGSGDEVMATVRPAHIPTTTKPRRKNATDLQQPPPDRPHRDKRPRKSNQAPASSQPTTQQQEAGGSPDAHAQSNGHAGEQQDAAASTTKDDSAGDSRQDEIQVSSTAGATGENGDAQGAASPADGTKEDAPQGGFTTVN